MGVMGIIGAIGAIGAMVGVAIIKGGMVEGGPCTMDRVCSVMLLALLVDMERAIEKEADGDKGDGGIRVGMSLLGISVGVSDGAFPPKLASKEKKGAPFWDPFICGAGMGALKAQKADFSSV